VINNHEQKHRRLDKYLVVAGPWAERNPNPANGDLYKDTDRGGMEFRFNSAIGASGTWLASNPDKLVIPFAPGVVYPATATAGAVLRVGVPDDLNKLYLEKLVMTALTATTLDATNNWTIQLFRQDSVPANTSLGTASTFATGRTAGKPYVNVITINALLANLTDAYQFFVSLTKNAAPGNLTFEAATLWYRMVGG
jgi:hypothetical protein